MYDDALPEFRDQAVEFNVRHPPESVHEPRSVPSALSLALDAVTLMRNFLAYVAGVPDVASYNENGHAIQESSIAIVNEIRGLPAVIYHSGAAAWLARTLAPTEWAAAAAASSAAVIKRLNRDPDWITRPLSEDPDWKADLERSAPTVSQALSQALEEISERLQIPAVDRDYDVFRESDDRDPANPAMRLFRDVELLYRSVRHVYSEHGPHLSEDEFQYLKGRSAKALSVTHSADEYRSALADVAAPHFPV